MKLSYTNDGIPFYEPDEGEQPVANPLYPQVSVQPNNLPLPVEQPVFEQPQQPVQQPIQQEQPQYIPVDHDPFEAAASRVTRKYENRNRASIEPNSPIDQLFTAEDRFQTWPEKMVRSAVTLPHDVMSGKVPTGLGLRREDFTDIPPPTREDVGQRFFTPIANQPNDAIVERAQDVAGMAGGTMFGIKPGVGSVGSGPLMKMGEQMKMVPVDYDPFAIDWYHGSARIDRVTEKGKIDPKRATSGPMPYFSDSPEVASNYATSKTDTSLAKFDPGDTVANYFTVSPKDLGLTRSRRPITVEQSWYYLPAKVKQEILAKAKRVGYEKIDTGEGPYTLHPEGVNAALSGDHYDWILKHEARGNPLAALREMWHDGGNLIGNEAELMEIYKLAGYPHKISDTNAPWVEARGVLPAKLDIKNPLMTDNKEVILNEILPKLEEAFKRDRTRRPYEAQMFSWDKDTRYTPKEWVQAAKEDYLKGDNSFVWTSIPDKVTAELKKLGFDGIIDTGGKGGGTEHKVAIPFSPEQVRSRFAKNDPKNVGKSGLLLSDSSMPGAPLAALASQAKAPTFYSAVEHAVNNIPQAKMPAEQWLGTLSNKPGVKPEELDWIGLKDFLAEKKGQTVTKQEVQDFVNANMVELKEVNKGTDYDKLNKIEEERRQVRKELDEVRLNKTIDRETKLAEMKRLGDLDSELTNDIILATSATKYHSYQLPGGENYREMLLTLPQKRMMPSFEEWSKANGYGNHEGARNLYEKIKTGEANDTTGNANAYKSSHWDEPNVLAHIRMNDRTMNEAGYSVQNLSSGNKSQVFATKAEAEAYQAKLPASLKTKIVEDQLPKKSLHIEEIQSDWHQQGRDKGYKNEAAIARKEQLFKELWEAKQNVPNDVAAKHGPIGLQNWLDENVPGYKEKYAEYSKIESSPAMVPDAPFKKSWHELALKRMIREAAEKGYDRLSWTPGEAQAARYDLSKQVDTISYAKQQNGNYSISVRKGKDEILNKRDLTASQLEETIGKEPTKKIVDNVGRDKGEPEGAGTLKGLDLKVGGEGMKGFYDQIIPRSLERIGKEHGVKVKQTKIGKDNVFYIDIPQSLKDTSMRKGFPLFSSGVMFVPIDHNPFEQQNDKL